METSYVFEEELFYEIFFDEDNSFLSNIGSFDELYANVFDYISSADFLNRTFDYYKILDWFYSRKNFSIVYFVFLLNNLLDNDINLWEYINTKNVISKKKYITYLNIFAKENNKNELYIGNVKESLKCKIGHFFIAQILSIAEDSKVSDFKRLVLVLDDFMNTIPNKSKEVKPNEFIKPSKQLPWCNDYKDSIKSSNSIWTVRKK
jgi:hypothetical protein